MSQNYYELMYILRPDLSEDQQNEVVERYNTQLTDLGASQLETDIRGKRRLAYPIQNFQDGVYVRLNYTAPGTHVAPLERAMRLSDEVIRYLTMVVEAPTTTDEVAEEEAAEATA
jgi:small subunit ribosomal protein S6